MRCPGLLLLVASLMLPRVSRAHGLWGHIHVTAWAVENMEPGPLKAFLTEDPAVFNALLMGAMFADTGYRPGAPAAARAYSEHSHWEPFVEDYVQWMRDNDPPPWDTIESKKRVAFLLGCASHGLQDALFDSLFLYQVEQRDGVGQDATDPGTDGFLVLDGLIRFVPETELPLETLVTLYAGLDEDVTAGVITESVDYVSDFYINDGFGLSVALSAGEVYAPQMPWGRAHYLDQDIPGSLRAEVFPTAAYQQAIWERLHDGLPVDGVTTFAFPEAPRRLRSGDPATPDSWVTLTFGKGVVYREGLVSLEDAAGRPVAFAQASNRWGVSPTRLVRLQPQEPLVPGAWYTARLLPGAVTVSGDQTQTPAAFAFQVRCLEVDDPDCPELGDLPEADIDGPDAGAVDTAVDSGVDAAPSADPATCGCSTAHQKPGLIALALLALCAVRRGDPLSWVTATRR